ncbi:MAG: DinB family protein [Isosphaeraceae bacterium]|nr:DinB family protein [Isosphaeraceae bacterium]
MTAKDLIRKSFALNDMIVHSYLDDMNDAEFKMIPVAGMNSIAWQIGHLIASEANMLDKVAPGASPALPEGFAAKYERGSTADASEFHTKDQLFGVWAGQRAATMKALDEIEESKFDDATGLDYAPTVGELLNLIANHPLMHAGQWVAVRRAANKKVAI